MFSKIIAVAIVLMMIPMAVSATVTTAVSGSVVDGTVTGSSSTQSDMYGDMHTLSGAQSDVMGSGTLNYASTTVSDGSDTQTAYFGSVAFGNLIGSASSFITQVTAPVSNMLCSGGVCKPTDASTQSTTPDKTCTEKTYSTTVSGSNYAIDNGYIESSTGVSSGTKAFTFTTAKASGSVAMFGSYNSMSGGCPFISSASGSSNYRFTGKVVNFNGAYING
jgi:hypothetical protein